MLGLALSNPDFIAPEKKNNQKEAKQIQMLAKLQDTLDEVVVEVKGIKQRLENPMPDSTKEDCSMLHAILLNFYSSSDYIIPISNFLYIPHWIAP